MLATDYCDKLEKSAAVKPVMLVLVYTIASPQAKLPEHQRNYTQRNAAKQGRQKS